MKAKIILVLGLLALFALANRFIHTVVAILIIEFVILAFWDDEE